MYDEWMENTPIFWEIKDAYTENINKNIKSEDKRMIVNFNNEEAIITFSGLQIVIQEEEAVDIARRILDYFEED